MGWQGRPPVAPPGFELAVVARGDSLLAYEQESGLSALKIAEANGVPNPGRKTCNWGRDVAAWILTTGGIRLNTDDNCGGKHVSFVEGQQIYLPVGLRARSGVPPPLVEPGTVRVAKRSALGGVIGAVVGGVVGAAVTGKAFGLIAGAVVGGVASGAIGGATA